MGALFVGYAERKQAVGTAEVEIGPGEAERWEYPIPADSDIIAEAGKRLAYVQSCLEYLRTTDYGFQGVFEWQ